MMKKIILGIAILVVAIFLISYLNNTKSTDAATVSPNEPVILFYGQECPHCKIVEDFIAKNNVTSKVKFAQAEIFHNKGNQQVFVEKEKACGVTDNQQMGVPMLWDNGKCYTGQDEVIKYFQDKMQNK